jgi:hypothetical protein
MNSNSHPTDNKGYQDLSDRLNALEIRLARLESERTLTSVSADDNEIEGESSGLNFKRPQQAHLESRIGEFGLAWLGNFVLFFGITFFVQYLQVSGFKLISSVFGFAAVAGIFSLAYYFRKSNSYMAKIFDLNGYLLIYYVTLKLHFYTPDPIIANKSIGLILLLIATGVILFLSIRKKYAVLAGLTLIFLSITALLSDSTHIMLLLVTLVAVISIVLLYQYGWIRIVFLSIFLVYFINLLWILGNPLMGHEVHAISEHHSGYIYLFLIAAIFSLIALMPSKTELYSDNRIIGSIILNGLGFSFIVALFILSFFKDNYVLMTGSIALFCIVYSIILRVWSHWKITAAFYALFGFVTLSVTSYGIYNFPGAYFLLTIQSLLVVSMALWFRSKFIVIINSALFIILLIVYLSTSSTVNGINISFTLVALITARIMNWKKDYLTIRTELIRNSYLIIAFFMGLFTLYHLVPKQYITLSWTLLAVTYFLLGLLIKIVKYRYLALGTMVAAALYLFIVDLARIELVFRVVALLFLALISIGLSFYYTKKLKKKSTD